MASITPFNSHIYWYISEVRRLIGGQITCHSPFNELYPNKYECVQRNNKKRLTLKSFYCITIHDSR